MRVAHCAGQRSVKSCHLPVEVFCLLFESYLESAVFHDESQCRESTRLLVKSRWNTFHAYGSKLTADLIPARHCKCGRMGFLLIVTFMDYCPPDGIERMGLSAILMISAHACQVRRPLTQLQKIFPSFSGIRTQVVAAAQQLSEPMKETENSDLKRTQNKKKT